MCHGEEAVHDAQQWHYFSQWGISGPAPKGLVPYTHEHACISLYAHMTEDTLAQHTMSKNLVDMSIQCSRNLHLNCSHEQPEVELVNSTVIYIQQVGVAEVLLA